MNQLFFARLAAARGHPAAIGLTSFAATIAIILAQPGTVIA